MRGMNLLAHKWGRLGAFFLLYVTEGLPLGFAATAIATYMRREGVGVDEIGLFIGALYAPWGFKWVMGPVVDLVRLGRIGHRRGWILLAQALMVVGLLLSVGVDYSAELKLFTAVMVGVNAVCALQDVAIDSLAVNTLQDEERGLGNGLMFAGAYIGQALGGAGMLYLAGRTGSLTPAFYAVAAMVAAVWLVTALFMREPEGPEIPEDQRGAAAVAGQVRSYAVTAARAMVGSVRAVAAAVFAFLPASAMALGLALAAALAVEMGLSDDEIATLSLAGAVLGALGSVSGGWISDRTGRRRTLAVYVLLSLLPTAYLAWRMQQAGWIFPLDPDGGEVPSQALVTVFWVVSLVYAFVAGLSYGTRMAIFMSVCNPEVAATQFTAYMAASNLAISYTAAWQGIAVERWGYPLTLALDCVAGVACLALLPLLRAEEGESQQN